MHHPQVLQSPILNDSIKVIIDGHTILQILPKFLFQVSVQEPHYSLFSDSVNGGLKEARDSDSNIFISDSTLRSLLTTQFFSSRYNVMCGCECCISAKSIHS